MELDIFCGLDILCLYQGFDDRVAINANALTVDHIIAANEGDEDVL